MSKKKYIWPKKKEYVKGMDKVCKFLYYLGIFKQVRWSKTSKGYAGTTDAGPDERPYQIHSGTHYSSVFGPRWWNPLTWIFVGLALIIGMCKAIVEFIQDIDWKRELEMEVHVYKPLEEEEKQ